MFDLKISYYNLNQLLMRYLEFNKVELTGKVKNALFPELPPAIKNNP